MLYSGSLTLLLLVHSAAFAPPPRLITTKKTARIHRAVSAVAEDAPMLYKAIGESTRFAVSGAVAATLLVRRDAETLTWVAGAILAAVCNKILKRIIKEDRPEAGDDGGMPSSHACSVCHLGVGAALRFPLTKLQIGGLAAYGATSLAWRVTNRYHTAPQVLVGGAFGAATAVAFRSFSKRLEAEVLPARIPLASILGIYGAGAVVVGSVERAKWLKRALKKER